MLKFILLCCLCSFFLAKTQAQSYEKGQVLVKFNPNINPKTALAQWKENSPTRLSILRPVIANMNIWLLAFDPENTPQDAVLYYLRHQKEVAVAQNNHIISKRVVPNDSQFAQQWQYINNGSNGGVADADIDADSAWAVTTGGVTALGDTIVVCVIDDGIDLTHQDFGANIWRNWQEIPNNNIDDDNNGFIDDYAGWNAYDNNDDISGGGHGTSVAGIVGARGDNSLGVAGVNWRVKLMLVNGGGNEADALAAYAYPLAMRRLYNQTGGQRGAFVVATNASWGVDNLQAADAPLWCAIYDSLGAEGVLSAGATTNSNTDVDIDGDMPTSCGSDYLIAVTNIRRNDTKEPAAGYGTNSVDLGAFGSSVWTTEIGNSYGAFGGTSGATPHVSGAIGLIFSVPCPRLAVRALVDPQGTALLVKSFILDGVDNNNSLQGISTTEGRLNLNNSIQLAMQSGCALSGCYEPFYANADQINGTSMRIHWPAVNDAQGYQLRYKLQTSSTWQDVSTLDTFLILNNLTACSEYEIQLLSDCDTSQSNYSRSFIFKTGDCCNAPRNVAVTNWDSFGINLSLQVDNFVDNYRLYLYDDAGLVDSFNFNDNNPSPSLNNLIPCHNYTFNLLSQCAVNANNNLSPTFEFKTKGCGACEDLNYCQTTGGTDASYEWISDIRIGDIINQTSSDDGYGDYTGTIHTTTLTVGNPIPFSFSLSQSNSSPTWRWLVWLDVNQDGQFDSSELLHNSGSLNIQTYDDSLDLPINTLSGITRMRISMKWGNSLATVCSTYTYGEVEDYCVFIENPISVVKNENVSNIQAFPNPFGDKINLRAQLANAADMRVEICNSLGQQVLTQHIDKLSSGEFITQIPTAELSAGVYFIRVWLDDKAVYTQKMIK